MPPRQAHPRKAARKAEEKVLANVRAASRTKSKPDVARATQTFLSTLRTDAMPTQPEVFRLPLNALDIQKIDNRKVVHQPPPFGKIAKCVYLSKRIPAASLPVHKCECYVESGKQGNRRSKAGGNKRDALRSRKSARKDAVCGDNCHNRMLFISCTAKTCSAPDPDLCLNRAIQRRQVKPVRVEYVQGPGFGLIADDAIDAGDFIIEYVGEVVDDEECERRLIKYRDMGETHFYMLELEKDIVIDARYRSNESRFINHSCEPNSVTQKWNVDGILRIGIFAKRQIAKDEEITIDYNFSHFGEAVTCKCGTPSCQGQIGRKSSGDTESSGGESVVQSAAPVDLGPPAEINAPAHVSSLALLKASQLETEWLEDYGYQKRRLFLSHKSHEEEPEEEVQPAVSPVSPTATSQRTLKDDWYTCAVRGDHLDEMRKRRSFICRGKSDWTSELSSMNSRVSRRCSQLRKKRVNLVKARALRCQDLQRFARNVSKWNARMPHTSASMDPERIERFVEHIQSTQQYLNPKSDDLNEDACHRCGLAGELICCDGCPAAFHLCCTNLAMVPPPGIPWFCHDCSHPRHVLRPPTDRLDAASAASPTTAVEQLQSRQLRSHAASLVPSWKRIFHAGAADQYGSKKRRKHKSTLVNE